jgi:hypothetical protein
MKEIIYQFLEYEILNVKIIEYLLAFLISITLGLGLILFFTKNQEIKIKKIIKEEEELEYENEKIEEEEENEISLKDDKEKNKEIILKIKKKLKILLNEIIFKFKIIDIKYNKKLKILKFLYNDSKNIENIINEYLIKIKLLQEILELFEFNLIFLKLEKNLFCISISGKENLILNLIKKN